MADHDHITGKFRGAAHNSCNLNYRIVPDIIEIPCFFHNSKNYDTHHILKSVKKEHGKVTCIPNNVEKLIQFTIGGVTFKDSYAFMLTGLDKLVQNLQPDQLCNTRRYLEVNEVNLDNEDQESVRSEDSDTMDTDDEQFINDEAHLDTENSEDEIQWMGEELERLIAPSQRYGFDDSDDNVSITSDTSPSDIDEDYTDEDYAHLINQHAGDFEGMDDLTRAIESMEQHYRNEATAES